MYLETDFFEQVKQVMITAYSFYTPLKALVQMIVSLHSYSVVKKKKSTPQKIDSSTISKAWFYSKVHATTRSNSM